MLVAGAALLAACTSDDQTSETGSDTASNEDTGSDTASAGEPSATSGGTTFRYPPAPEVPSAETSAPQAGAAIDRIVEGLEEGGFDSTAVGELAETGDARHAWFVADLLRFFGGAEGAQLVVTFETLTGVSIDADPDAETNPWLSVSNHLIAWDTPDYPGYREDKSGVFLLLEPRWEPFFTDADAAIDWRHLSWGGVLIDDRPFGDPDPCPQGCIPALDDPAVTDAADGDWYPDEAIVFGVVVGDEALAIPKNLAEVHEMFNLTLGGRRLAVPYCTLCGSAQAYFTDRAIDTGTNRGTDTATGTDEPYVLRTSGLLARSNKVMYELGSRSVFDTFTGAAVSGPLHDEGVVLEETTVVRSTWGAWRAAHPETTIIAEDGGIGRSYPADPLGGRDDDGPIFPIGAADDRLGVQELVVGVIAADGTAVAFPSDVASTTLGGGGSVEAVGVRLVPVGDGLRALDVATGAELAAHEAFWFAWSQFHPGTALWAPDDG